MAMTLTSIQVDISTYNFRNGMNPEMACSSVLTSWETSCGDVFSSCIVNKSERAYYS